MRNKIVTFGDFIRATLGTKMRPSKATKIVNSDLLTGSIKFCDPSAARQCIRQFTESFG